MAKTGIAVPFRGDGRGRLVLATGPDETRKVVLLNLSDCASANPFQGEVGLGSAMVFALQDTALQSELKRRVAALFRRLQLQGRARLAEPAQFVEMPATQELEASIRYVDVETNKPEEVVERFSPGTTTPTFEPPR